MAKQRTTQFDETRDEASDVCTRLLLGGLADSCERFVDSENAGIGNPTSSNSTDSRECPAREGANKGVFDLGNSARGDIETAYDRAITGIIPVLTLAWSKQQSSTIDPGWTDARLVCMRPSQISAGSRVPDGVPEESLGVRMAAGCMILSLASA
ncbi:MAG: hypothetical protein L6R38_000495, partial [Xanthoria sp. 2 TBL-2021]